MYVCIFIIFTLVALFDQTQRDALAKEVFSYLEYPSSKSYELCDDNKSNNINLFFLNNNNNNKLLFLNFFSDLFSKTFFSNSFSYAFLA
jgi:hypothetical protein